MREGKEMREKVSECRGRGKCVAGGEFCKLGKRVF
jgi:hypothetical protein